MIIKNGVLLDVDNADIVNGTFIIPDEITIISDSAFSYCRNLKSITIPASVTSIESYAFYKCSSLTSVTIGNGVTSIGDNAFVNCSSLTSITIPDSVTSIGFEAFRNCNRLVSKKSNYKAFELKNGELYCRDKKYIENVENSVQGELKMCENGIHYCTNFFEIFNWYHGELDKYIAIYEIEVGDKVLTSDTSKCCTNSCVLKKRLYKEDIIKILSGEEI